MEALPEDVEAALLRAVGAYLRATPAAELPSNLRRFSNFRPKALLPHRRAVLDALDDTGFRARVGEWLDERPSLAKGDAALVRLAVDRADGWVDDLRSAAKPKKSTPNRSEDGRAVDVEREQARLRKVRDEARRQKEGSQREIQALQARVAELEQELQRRITLSAELQKQVTEAEKTAAKAARDLEREQRKARAAAERATESVNRARSDAKEARRELQRLQRESARTQTKQGKPRPRSVPAAAPSGPRRPLAVPKGRFEDDPQTLEAWLDADGVHLLVDGYNATMSREGFGNLDLEGQRKRLVDEVTMLARRKRFKATVVFDGSDVVAKPHRSRGSVAVRYSAPDEIADDYLVALLESMPPVPIVVATSDRELQERARTHGATICTSEQLVALLRGGS